MMHHPRIARPKLHGRHVLLLRQIQRYDKTAIDIPPFRGDRKRTRFSHHQIRRSQLPARGKLRLRRQVGGIALRPAGRIPGGDGCDLRIGQPPHAGEITEVWRGFPRRHVPILRLADHFLRVLADLLIGQ